MTQQALTIVAEEAQLTTPQGLIEGLDLAAIQGRVADINTVIDSLMEEGVHYGKAFPGSKEDSLLQPGAELLFMAFQMVPNPEPIEEKLDGGHLRITCIGEVTSADGRPMGRLSSECSTMEVKYRFRTANLVCPECQAEEIRKSKRREGDPQDKIMGYYCWKKMGGCGAQFLHNDESITGQMVGKVENENPEDKWHTVRRMSEKRWLVALARRTFSLSGRFVDQEGAQDATFDVNSLAPILRALPGDREAKWAEVVAFTLQRFAKAPADLTCLEGSVVLRWLGRRVDGTASLSALDFGESPEGAVADPKSLTEKEPKKAGSKESRGIEKLSTAQYAEVKALLGESGVDFPALNRDKGWDIKGGYKNFPAGRFVELCKAIRNAASEPAGEFTAEALPVKLISDDDLVEVKELLKEHGKIFADVNRVHNLGISGGPSKIPAHRVEEVCIAINPPQAGQGPGYEVGKTATPES